MKTFMYTVLALAIMDIVWHLIYLAGGRIPQRTPGTLAIAVFLNACLAGWAIFLLAKA